MKYLLTASLTLFLMAHFSVCKTYGQISSEEFAKYKTPNPIPPSPNPSSLGKFGNIPVSLYTGVPSISVPLFDVEVGNVTMPIKLNYHAGGIRVEEIASSVGLSWNLAAGGVINRTVRGKPDEYPEGYMDTNHDVAAKVDLFNNDRMTPAEKKDFMFRAAGGSLDTEPDIFEINVPGILSEKFIFKPGIGFSVMPRRKIRISGDPINGFVITNTDGNRFYFEEKEAMQVIPQGNKTGQNGGPFTHLDPLNYNSSWHLSKVVLADGNVISFTYTTTTIKPRYNGTVSVYDCPTCLQERDCNGNPYFEKQFLISTYNDIETKQKKVNKIDFPSGVITFTYDAAQRTDLPGDYALKEVVVANKKTVIKKFQLSHSFKSNRLFLDKVSLLSSNGASIGSYSFSYANADKLPPRDSYAQDYWGFYNGALNGPYMENREPDAEKTLYGLLNRITYPTGGTSDLVYEPHRYGSIAGKEDVNDTITQPIDTTILARASGEPPTPINSPLFYVPFQQSIFVIANVKGSSTYAKILKEDGTPVFALGGKSPDLETVYQYVELDPGRYYVSVFNYELEFRADINFKYIKEKRFVGVNKYKLAGGARIKMTIDRDPGSALRDTTSYFYAREEDPGRSSGILNNTPVYTYKKTLTRAYSCPNGGGGGAPVNIATSYNVRQSQSAVATILTGGSHIGYSTVTVLKGTKGLNGKTVSNFSHYGQYPDFIFSGYPFTASVSRDYMRGQLTSRTDYKREGAAYKPLRKEVITYSYEGDGNWIAGANIGFGGENKVTPDQSTFAYKRYFQVTYFRALQKKVDTVYDGNTPLTTEDNYYYENPDNLMNTKVLHRDSKGNDLIQSRKYPHDYAGAAPVYDSMVKRNIIDPVVEITNYKNTTNLNKEKANYSLWQSGRIIEPSKVLSQILNYPENTDASYTSYDIRGNPMEFAAKDGLRTVILWGYNYQLPVAKITGSNLSTVYPIVSQSLLQNPPGDKQLRDSLEKIRSKLAGTAIVTTYTYLPLVGITSETDPRGKTTYYEYDAFGRLKAIKDRNERILKLYDYQYQASSSQAWQLTGKTRCQTGTGGYKTGVIEKEEKDTNPESSTYGSLRWVSGGQSSSCPVVADWKATGNTRCQTGTGGYLTGKAEREEIDKNPYSGTYNNARWVETGVSPSCVVTADWKATGNSRCITGTGGYPTGRQEIEQKDMNPYSASYNTTRWLDNGISTSCPVNPDWKPTGNTRCQYINNAYTGHQEREEKDMNPYTSTSGGLRWTDTGESSSCSTTPRWTNTGIDRCMVDAWNSYTGVVEVEQKDTNPYSTTYNTVKWANTGLTGNCPLPPSCLTPEYRAVNNVCESGTRIGLVESEELQPNKWRCTYWVSYSYGPSEKITVFSSRPCSVPPPPAKSASH